jgi:DNA polymerase-1
LTTLKIPVTKGGRTDTEEYDGAGFKDKYGILPELFIDVKGLMGDSSDNIPGVAGIGEKTALELVNKYGNLESIYENIDNISKISVKEKLTAGKEMAFLSRRLATICRDLPLELALDEFEKGAEDRKKLYKLFRRLQFQSYLLKMNLTEADAAPYENHYAAGRNGVAVVNTIADLDRAVAEYANTKALSFYPIFDKKPLFGPICVGITLYEPEKGAYYADVRHFPVKETQQSVLRLFNNDGVEVISHDIKQIFLWFMRNGYERCPSFGFDTMLGGYMSDSSSGKYSISELSSQYLERTVAPPEELTGKGKARRELSDISAEELSVMAISAAKAIYDLAPVLKKEISENSQDQLYYEVEIPLAEVLAFMEFKGIAVDRDGLRDFSRKLESHISKLVSEIYELAGEEFNVNSTKQLGSILYDKLGLKPAKKTKTGYSTGIDALEDLYGKHEIVEKIVEYRQYAKLKSTYADGLAELVDDETGRIYSTFNQAVTATGRISSTEPNLQNIPVRLELGREIRRLFIPGSDEYVLMGADYSQVELRVLAHLSEDENMIEAFRVGTDIHTATASKVFGVPESDVTPQMRTKAKAVNFGIVYGIGEFSLAKDIGVTRKEAGDYIESYLSKYDGVRRYMRASVDAAKQNGYALTIMNRRRLLPELKSSNFNIRSFGERVAMNTPVQGSAADIIKIAMIKVYRELRRGGLKSTLILQVHDELLIEAHKDEIEAAAAILKDAMENAVSMDVPLVADVYYGDNWKDIKG